MHNPSKQNPRQIVKMRFPLEKLRNDGLRLRGGDANSESVHEEKKSISNFDCDGSSLEETDPLAICDSNLKSVHEENLELAHKQNLKSVHEEKLESGYEESLELVHEENFGSGHEEKKSETTVGCVEKYKVFETQKPLPENNVAVRYVSVNDGRKISDFQILGYHSKKGD